MPPSNKIVDLQVGHSLLRELKPQMDPVVDDCEGCVGQVETPLQQISKPHKEILRGSSDLDLNEYLQTWWQVQGG